MKSIHADEIGTRLSAENEARFRAWAVANGVTDVDHPETGIDYRGYWLAYVSKPGGRGPDGETRKAATAAPPDEDSPGARWVARTFLKKKAPAGHSRLEAALLARRRRGGARG